MFCRLGPANVRFCRSGRRLPENG